jgi:ubiquinone/menaquinone biosynthesis C-methylase UbiE
VVGVDMNAEILDTAAARVQAAGWSTVVFRGGDVLRLDLEGFDAVVGRWVLQYTPDPAGLLPRAPDWLRRAGSSARTASSSCRPSWAPGPHN